MMWHDPQHEPQLSDYMDTKLKRYVELRGKRDELQTTIEDKTRPFKAEIEAIKDQIAEATKDETVRLALLEKDLDDTQENIIEMWAGPNVVVVDGHKVTKSHRMNVDVLDENALINACASFEKKPYVPKWDNKTIRALVEASVLPKDLVALTEKQFLTLQKVKKAEAAAGE